MERKKVIVWFYYNKLIVSYKRRGLSYSQQLNKNIENYNKETIIMELSNNKNNNVIR